MSNEKQQGLVDWIEQEMLKPNLSMKEILEQAKEMEKERTIGLAQQVLFDFLELEGNDRTHLAIKIWACDKLIETYGGEDDKQDQQI
jgi:hypothetical protein